MNKQYKWRFRPAGAPDADVAAAEIERLSKMHDGGVTPRILLEAAKNPENPLHKAFEWDDTAAAEAYRLQQATTLIVQLKVEVVGDSTPRDVQLSVRAFAHVAKDENSAPDFRPMEAVMGDSYQRSQLLAKAAEDLRSWKARYGSLKEFAALSQVIEDTLKEAV